MSGRVVTVNDKMQKGYQYSLEAPMGQNFNPAFRPDFTPKQMFALGVFGGKYMTDCTAEFPADWFTDVKFSAKKNIQLNYFKVDASKPLSYWREKGWINEGHDPRGWFQWYCRYYMGRRIPHEDLRQIKRWKAMKRHIVQISKNCKPGDIACRPRQRQALLHWAYDSRRY